jgi:hypothetical protein
MHHDYTDLILERNRGCYGLIIEIPFLKSGGVLCFMKNG